MTAHRVIAADPPWKFGDRLPGATRGAGRHYPTMTVEEMCGLRTGTPDDIWLDGQPIAPDAVLFLWRVAAMQEEALRIMRSWGFAPKSEIVWRKLTSSGKVHFGMGRYVRQVHEVALIGVRGRCFPRIRNQRSIFDAVRPARHSEKPDDFYRIVEEMYDGPYLEMFARRQRPGWTCVGNEANP